METIRIHEDQENRAPEVRQQKTMMAAQKRSAFGVIDENVVRNSNIEIPKGKQPFASCSFANVAKCNKENIRRDADVQKANLKNLVNPIVPVAQFEAFKVYEDKRETVRYQEEDEEEVVVVDEKSVSKNSIYKDESDLEEQEAHDVSVPQAQPESPMSIEKSYTEMSIDENSVIENTRQKDLFFEVDEYRQEIYMYLREHELRNRAKPGYMRKQPDVTSNMRTILVDWLVEVAQEYKLHNETLYLAVNYIDRFLSYMSVVRAKLQLVGTAAMFLASKYEEIYPPNIKEFVYITDDTYTIRQVIRMEQLILKVLGFDLSVPTPLCFIKAICVSTKQSKETMYLAMYICEFSLLNGEMYLEFLPSTLAASAIAIARHNLNLPIWPEEYVQITIYDLKSLSTCIDFLNSMYKSAATHAQRSIQDKYKHQKYLHVSQREPSDKPIVTG